MSSLANSPEGKIPPPPSSPTPSLAELAKQKPLDSTLLLKRESLKKLDLDYISVIFNQVAALLLTTPKDSWKPAYHRIRYILDNEARYYRTTQLYYQKLVDLINPKHQSFDTYTVPDLVFIEEAKRIAEDPTDLNFLISVLASRRDKDLVNLISNFIEDTVLGFVIACKLGDVEDLHQLWTVKDFSDISSQIFGKSDKAWNVVALDCILSTPIYPFVHKLKTLANFGDDESLLTPVKSFFDRVGNMSFKELLLEVGPDNLLPEKLLPILVHIKQDEADACIALILAEVLIPGSQNLASTNGRITALTQVNSMPEANAKGAKLQACLREVEQNESVSLNWFAIFAKVQENLFDASQRSLQPSATSLTQFFSALDYKEGLIDIFLSYEWYFAKSLLYALHSFQSHAGAFDLFRTSNIVLCFEDEANGPPQLLKFINIAKLEVQVIAAISGQSQQQPRSQSENEKSLDAWLTLAFEVHCRTEPHHVIAGALAIADKSPFILDRIDREFAFMMDRPLVDQNLAEMEKVITRFKELDIDSALNRMIDYYTNRLNRDSLFKVVRVASMCDLSVELINRASMISPKLFLTFLAESSGLNFGYKSLIDAELAKPAQKEILPFAILEFLEERAAQDFEAAQEPLTEGASAPRPLNIALTYELLEIVKSFQSSLDAFRLKTLQLSLLTTYPRLINFGSGHDEAILTSEQMYGNSFPPEVEQEMKSIYSKMYNKELEIKEIIEMLTRLKVSDQPHDQDVFACMIHSLIDEYKFFSEYPLTALASTSLLFGGLLQKNLIQGTTLTVALNFIWDSCNQSPDSHLFKFAVQSLYNFKSRLHEYPSYCKHLLKCKSLATHSKMLQIVKDAANGIPCPETSGAAHDNAKAAKPDVPVNIYNSISATEKVIGTAPQEAPAEAISDKLLFFVNNSTADNLLEKLEEVRNLLEENYFAWFARYLVEDRAKIEPNNHELYAKMVFAVNNEIFYEYVLNTTLLEVDKLLRHFKDSANDRTHSKNLGSWLGKITLANDRPLKRDQVALKYMLMESYEFKTLHLIIPFVCKILDQAVHSKVFRPPNPWVLGIIRLLCELYECADLKLNLKFEIEVLLNAFEIKLKDVEPSLLIRTQSTNPEALAILFGKRIDPVSLQNDMAKLHLEGGDVGALMQQIQHSAMLQQPQQANAPFQLQGRHLEEPDQKPQGSNPLDALFSNLIGNTVFTQNPNLRRAFQASLARAVRECAVPILNRVSDAVLTTTEALIKKDFATEGDIAKFRNAYQILAQQLAHSMVACTGRKLLSETIEATMLQLLSNQINPNELPLAELSVAIQSNVDLCVDIVGKLAASNISELIDERMRPLVILRENNPPGKPFHDENALYYALNLPPPLGLSPDGLLESQLKIYSNFGSNVAVAEPTPIANTETAINPHGNLGGAPGVSSIPPIANSSLAPQQPAGVPNDDATSMDQLFNVITLICDKAIQMLGNVKETSLGELSANHPILQALSQTLTLCQNNVLKHPDLLLRVAQYAVNCLFTQGHENPMSNEIHVVLLDRLCEYSPSTAKDVTWWMVHSVDQRKFNMPVMFSLLKVGLVSAINFDGSIGRLILEPGSPVIVNFASNLLIQVFNSDQVRPIALRSEFGATIEALSKWSPPETDEGREAEAARDELFSFLSRSERPWLPPSDVKAECIPHMQMGYIFAEWVKLLGHGLDEFDLQNRFIERLFRTGVLTLPDKFELLFRLAIEISTMSFATEHEIRSRTQREVYLTVDSLGILIVKIILRFSKLHTAEAIDYFKNIMGIIVSTMINEHETSRATWNERAYFKLLSTILCTWCDASQLDEEATLHLDGQFFPAFGEVLLSLQPLIYPGFTFAWISLIAHRMFLPKVLSLPGDGGYNIACKLLKALLRFQTTYSKDDLMHHDVISVIFKAINRIFAAILHDSPEFLIKCHYNLVSAVPVIYYQLRNIILSASPKGMELPNPFDLRLSIDDLPEVREAPAVHVNPLEDLAKVNLKKSIENFLRIPAPALMRTIYGVTKLNHAKETAQFGLESEHYNVKLINAVVLHVGISSSEEQLAGGADFNPKSSQASLLIDLINHGSTEFCFHIVNAIANQLRYPNAHTHWFLLVLLYMFGEAGAWNTQELHLQLQEIVVRVLLERHIVTKPHPWGISVALVKLINDRKYRLFELPFVQGASAELRMVFDALATNVKA